MQAKTCIVRLLAAVHGLSPTVACTAPTDWAPASCPSQPCSQQQRDALQLHLPPHPPHLVVSACSPVHFMAVYSEGSVLLLVLPEMRMSPGTSSGSETARVPEAPRELSCSQSPAESGRGFIHAHATDYQARWL
jgi:hypothetical protein